MTISRPLREFVDSDLWPETAEDVRGVPDAVASICVDHPKGPDGFDTLAEAEEFAASLEEQGIDAEVCFFSAGHSPVDRRGMPL